MSHSRIRPTSAVRRLHPRRLSSIGTPHRFDPQWVRLGCVFAIAAVLLGGAPETEGTSHQPGDSVLVLELRGMVNPVSERYLVREIEIASTEAVRLVVIELDTPGGLLESTHRLTSAMLGADVPVAVFITPDGSRAASAGVFLTMAAHIAAMSPATRIGAATPVAVGEDLPADVREKLVNDTVVYARSIAEARGRNADWAERAVRDADVIDARTAEELGVVDLVATDRRAFLEAVDGRMVVTASGAVAVATRDARVEARPMSLFESILMAIADPNIALLLLSLGGLAIYLELSNPGVMVPGIAGAVFLLLGFLSLGVLPVSFAGVALVLLGLVLLGAEIFITSGGVLGAGGVASFALGSLVLIDDRQAPFLEVSRPLIATLAVTLGAFILVAARHVVIARRRPLVFASDGLVGRSGVASSADGVLVSGERWRARSSDGAALPVGARVRVAGRDGFVLTVHVDDRGDDQSRESDEPTRSADARPPRRRET